MKEEQPRQRHKRMSPGVQARRIMERLRGGWAYDGIARAEVLQGAARAPTLFFLRFEPVRR